MLSWIPNENNYMYKVEQKVYASVVTFKTDNT